VTGAADPDKSTDNFSLVALNPNSDGTARPLFLVHPVGGTVMTYQPLVKHLSANQPVFAFENVTMFHSNRRPYSSAAAMAERYTRELSRVQPQGPYTLGGFSMGGVVAFEMARQLRAAGHEIDAVILLDTPARIRGPVDTAQEPGTARVMTIAKVITTKSKRQLSISAEDVERVPPADRVEYLVAMLKQQGVIPAVMDGAVVCAGLTTGLHNEDIQRRYEPGMFDGPVFLTRALDPYAELQEETGSAFDDPAFGWQAVSTRPVEIVWVPGAHLTFLHPPHVQSLAVEIQRRLDRRPS
jgi:thioesterase domain-containing protein